MQQAVIILHTPDLHGRIEGLARVATRVARIREENPGVPVLYMDAGDSEETANRLSNLTKGTAMHRLLSAAGCAVATVGNGAILRYGTEVLADQARAATYPLLLANLRRAEGALPAGVQATARLQAGALAIGLIGVTAEFDAYRTFFGLQMPPVGPLVRELAAALRQDGADLVILLSHLGLPADRALAAEVQDAVDLIIGAHTHNLLPEGEWVGEVLIAQAGEYAEHLGRLDLGWDGDRLVERRASVLPITEVIPPDAGVLAEAAAAEAEIAQFLAEEIGELAASLDYAADRECGTGNFMADVLRDRMQAEVGLVAVGQAFTGPLAAGPLARGSLWDVCSSSANPGLVPLTGAQLAAIIARGQDPAFAADQPRSLRGAARGLIHLSGARLHAGQVWVGDQPLDPSHHYRVAGSDWEFEELGGYVAPDWELQPEYEVPLILREAAESYLAAHRPLRVPGGRLG